MGIGCPHCRVIGDPHDDGCPWHPSAVAVQDEFEDRVSELEADNGRLLAENARLRKALEDILGCGEREAAWDIANDALAKV